MASSSTGRIPQGEVVMDFADGGSYIKDKLEQSVLDLEKRRIQKEEGLKAQKAMEALDVGKSAKPASLAKSEDIDLLVNELGIPRSEAEEGLNAEGGDLVKAMIRLVRPAPRARSVDGGGIAK